MSLKYNPDNRPILIFGLTAPIGSKIDLLQTSLESEIRSYGYDVHIINVSNIIEKISDKFRIIENIVKPLRIDDKIKLGNKICSITEEKDYLAKATIKKINNIIKSNNRKEEDNLIPKEKNPLCFIIRQLKRPEEIKCLKKCFGEQFIQISANNDESIRSRVLKDIIFKEYPEKGPTEVDNFCRKIISDDADESREKYGQRISKTFYTADFFVNCKSREAVDVSVKRFIKGIFGSNLISPTKDEYGSYFANASSLKSVDTSRQVGAAIFTPNGEIVITGCNDVAKAGGGLFWEEDQEKNRDIDIGSEANKEETSRIIYSFLKTLENEKIILRTTESLLSDQKIKETISKSMIGEITEYGRMVHAEMNAITDAARLGRPLKDTNMYVTTYPCHNCAKHIVSSGTSRVVYIEPYPKSRASKLYRHAITDSDGLNGVKFVHFYGISPSLYKMIFERSKRRDQNGKIQEWQNSYPFPIVAVKDFSKSMKIISDEIDSKISKLQRMNIDY